MMAKQVTLVLPRHQRGASLIFALITLVSMMLAAIALVRSVGSTSQILGNIGFQQDATAAADQASRTATDWIVAQTDWSTSSTATSVATTNTGFYANVDNALLDATGRQIASPLSTRKLVNWDNDSCAAAVAEGGTCTYHPKDLGTINSNKVSYVIFRLCQNTGSLTGNTCALPLTATATGGNNNGAVDAGNVPGGGTATGQYFRIVVRVVGFRDTTSFTETIVQY